MGVVYRSEDGAMIEPLTPVLYPTHPNRLHWSCDLIPCDAVTLGRKFEIHGETRHDTLTMAVRSGRTNVFSEKESKLVHPRPVHCHHSFLGDMRRIGRL